MNLTAPTANKLLQLIDVIWEWVPYYLVHCSMDNKQPSDVKLTEFINYDYVSEVTTVMVRVTSKKNFVHFCNQNCNQTFSHTKTFLNTQKTFVLRICIPSPHLSHILKKVLYFCMFSYLVAFCLDRCLKVFLKVILK